MSLRDSELEVLTLQGSQAASTTPRWKPASQTCQACGGRRPPRLCCFALSGTLANALQLALDRLTLMLLPDPSLWWVPTACWALSYAGSVPFRFVLHSLLVFGPPVDPLPVVLSKSALAYLFNVFVSSLVNLALVTWVGLSHELALVGTASVGVIVSYAAFSLVWSTPAFSLPWAVRRAAEVRGRLAGVTKRLRPRTGYSVLGSDTQPSCEASAASICSDDDEAPGTPGETATRRQTRLAESPAEFSLPPASSSEASDADDAGDTTTRA